MVAAYPGYHVIDEGGLVRDTIRPIEYSPLEAFRLIETESVPVAWSGARCSNRRRLGSEASFHGRLHPLDEGGPRRPGGSGASHSPRGDGTPPQYMQRKVEHAREHLEIVGGGLQPPRGFSQLSRGDF